MRSLDSQPEEDRLSLISEKRWKSYAVAGAAVAAGTAAASAVIVSGITPATDMIDAIPDDENSEEFRFELLTNTDLLFFASTSTSSGFLVTGPTGLSFAGFAANGYFYPSNVVQGEVIGNMTFGVTAGQRGYMAFEAGYPGSQFVDTGGYVAFTFNTVETGVYHGWAQLEVISGSPRNEFRLVKYAYANEADGLTVGQMAPVPEPGSMASLALGAVGLLSWRRTRRREV